MGDRVSISFCDYNDDGTVFAESVALFDHWAGQDLVQAASQFAQRSAGTSDEPGFAMVRFIREFPDFDGYLGRNGRDGGNSDNGHWRISLQDGSAQQVNLGTEEERLIDDLKQENEALKAKLYQVASRLYGIVRDLIAGEKI